MALKFLLKTLEGLDDAVKGLYVQQQNGEFQLDVEGAVASTKLAEFRDNNITLKKQLEAFEGLDPQVARDAIKFQEGAKDKQMFDNGKIEELITSRTQKMKEEYDGAIKTKDEMISTQTRQLEGLLIDSAVRNVAIKSAVMPTALDDVLLRAKTVFKLEKGVATPFDNKGQVMYGKDGVSPMSIDEWIGGLNKTAPHLFEGNAGGGAPRGGGGPGGGDPSKMSATQKIAQGLQK